MSSIKFVREQKAAPVFIPLFCLFVLVPASKTQSQIVQLPTTGTFSLQTSVMAPDSGSAYLGGNLRSSAGRQSVGPGSQAAGSSASSGNASARATIIDLNELDLMIRSQASGKPTIPDLISNRSKPPQYSIRQKGTQLKAPEYEYLAKLSHREQTATEPVSSDTNYYLSLATNAKQKGHWAAVELYYKLAWGSLPESRRDSVLKSLEQARNKIATDKDAASTTANVPSGTK